MEILTIFFDEKRNRLIQARVIFFHLKGVVSLITGPQLLFKNSHILGQGNGMSATEYSTHPLFQPAKIKKHLRFRNNAPSETVISLQWEYSPSFMVISINTETQHGFRKRLEEGTIESNAPQSRALHALPVQRGTQKTAPGRSRRTRLVEKRLTNSLFRHWMSCH